MRTQLARFGRTALAHRPRAAVLLVFAAVFCGSPGRSLAATAGTCITIHPERDLLLPGEEVALSWGDLPRGAEEFELLLECSAPARVTLRLTESLDPGLRDHRWRVPNVPCDAGRVRLRVGVDGEESVWAASAPFRIVWDEIVRPARISSRRGELWLVPPNAHDDASSLTGLARTISGSLSCGDAEVELATPPRGLPATVTAAAASNGSRTALRERAAALRTRDGKPLSLQLRI